MNLNKQGTPFIPKVGLVTNSNTLKRVVESHLEGEVQLIHAGDLEELQDALNEGQLHVILCDREPLEGVRAEEVMKELCEREMCNLPFVVFTSSEQLQWTLADREPDLVLFKPFNSEILKEADRLMYMDKSRRKETYSN